MTETVSNRLKQHLASKTNLLLLGRSGVGKTAILREALQENGLGEEEVAVYSPSGFHGCVYTAKVILFDDLNTPPARRTVKEILSSGRYAGKPVAGAVWATYSLRYNTDWDKVYPFLNRVENGSLKFSDENAQKILRGIADIKQSLAVCTPEWFKQFDSVLEVPFKPSLPFFEQKHGDLGKKAVNWWRELPEDAQNLVSPRSLDVALISYKNNGDLRDVLPISCNISRLIKALKDK